MKKTLIFYIAAQFFLLNVCSSQAYKYVYYFDGGFNNVDKSQATVIGKGIKEDELFRLDCYTKENEVLLLSIHYVDSSLVVMEGKFTAFYRNGNRETQGNYLNDKRHGLWEKWDSLGHKTDSTFYHEDKALTVAAFNYHKNGRLRYYSFKDSLADTFSSRSYDDSGVISREIVFKGQKGVEKRYRSGTVDEDSLFTREQREAKFPGGQQAWVRYLEENLDHDVPVRKGAPSGTYQVIVKFIIDMEGIIKDVVAETHHGYGMENELIRVIKKGSRWEPASQYGRKIEAYRRQTITFFVEEVK